MANERMNRRRNRHMDRRMERRIETAIVHAAPDRTEELRAACRQNTGGASLRQTGAEKGRTPRRFRPAAFAAAAAALILCVGALGFMIWRSANAVESRIMLDVNPSLSITVNARERVIDVTALNADAQAIVGSMDLKGTQLEVAVNALVGSMLQNGYLGELQNAILVSVENNDAAKSAELQARITASINGLFPSSTLEPAVLSQTVAESDDLTALAQQYGISEGKAALIRALIAQDATLSFDTLAPLGVNEITLIADSRGLTAEEVTRTGTASQKAYIGEEQAKAAACAHAGVTQEQVSFSTTELDCEAGLFVYEIEFIVDQTEYDYDIDARTGAVVKYSSETYGEAQSSAAGNAAYIGEAQARAAAFAHSGVSASDATAVQAKLDIDDGQAKYEIVFFVGTTEYDYDIDARTGAVLKAERETYSSPAGGASPDSGSSGSASSASGYIGEDRARSIALEHAGVSASEATGITVKLARDDGRAEYEVKFLAGTSSYDYEIDATTGAICKAEREEKGGSAGSSGSSSGSSSSGSSSSGSSSSDYIGESRAKSIALGHAGVSASEASGMRVKLERDNGRMEYEVEFSVGRREYEYEIDAVTGKILKADSEIDD